MVGWWDSSVGEQITMGPHSLLSMGVIWQARQQLGTEESPL